MSTLSGARSFGRLRTRIRFRFVGGVFFQETNHRGGEKFERDSLFVNDPERISFRIKSPLVPLFERGKISASLRADFLCAIRKQ